MIDLEFLFDLLGSRQFGVAIGSILYFLLLAGLGYLFGRFDGLIEGILFALMTWVGLLFLLVKLEKSGDVWG